MSKDRSEQPASFQELVRHRQRSAFVGRESELETFLRNLQAPIEERALLVSITGQGGIGKTFLARRFKELAVQQGFAAGWSDESEQDAVEVMSSLARDFGADRFKSFFDGERVYRARRHEIESDPEVPLGLVESLGGMLGRGGVRLGRHAPLIGIALELVSEDTAEETGRQAASAVSFIARKLKDKEEVRLVSDPLGVLTPRFVEGLAQVVRERGVLLVFDTYEATRLTIEAWLRDLLNGEYGALPPDLVVTIAGRDPLDPNLWADYEAVLLPFSIETFAPEEAREYLSRHGLTEPEVVAEIVELAQGMPLLLATLASGSPATLHEIGDATDTATERFLKWLATDDHRQIALKSAVPRVLDVDVLEALLNDRRAATDALDWLRQMPFVLKRRDGWRYHDLVRSLFSAQLRRESAQAWKEANERLAASFEDGPSKALAEICYHTAAADPHRIDIAVVRILTAVEADDHQWALTLAQAVRQGQHDAGVENPHVVQLADALSRRADADLADALEGLLNDDILDAGARAQAHLFLARACLEDVERARAHALAAVMTGRNQLLANAIVAVIGRLRGDTRETLEHVDRALALAADAAPGEISPTLSASLYDVQASALERSGDVDAALHAIEEALSLTPDDAEFRITRARLISKQGRHQEALDDLEVAASAFPEYVHAAREHAAGVSRALGDREALDAYTRALEQDPECLTCWWRLAALSERLPEDDVRRALLRIPSDGPRARVGRVRVLLKQPALAEARALVDELLRSGEDLPELLVTAATLHLNEDEASDAAPLLQRAEQDEGVTWSTLLQVAACYRRMDDLAGAERCVSAALVQTPTSRLRLARAEVRTRRGNVTGALSDLRLAREIEERDPQVLELRAQLGRDLRARELALADLDLLRAELAAEEPASSAAFTRLGLLRSHLGQWDEALADTERAIELDSTGLAARYNRIVVLARRDGVEPHLEAIAELQRGLDEGTFDAAATAYAHAGLAALLGESETAGNHLARALASSYVVREWAVNDRAFDDLRDEPALQALLAPADDIDAGPRADATV